MFLKSTDKQITHVNSAAKPTALSLSYADALTNMFCNGSAIVTVFSHLFFIIACFAVDKLLLLLRVGPTININVHKSGNICAVVECQSSRINFKVKFEIVVKV